MKDNTLDSFWLPEPISKIALHSDKLFYVELWGTCLILFTIVGVMIYFICKYRITSKRRVACNQNDHNNKLEIAWTIIPTIVVLILFFWGFKDFLSLSIPPKNSMEIKVTAKKWMWTFEYPKANKQTVGELVVPINHPIKLIMSSQDVIHGFYLPNLRIKRDVLPNRYTVLWFQAEKIGEFQIFCAEYCGDAHSNMLATLKVLSTDDYNKWVKQSEENVINEIPLNELGRKLYKSKGCSACHSTGISKMSGPGWGGLFMSKKQLENGDDVVADENYLRESIVNPADKIVKGYPSIMPTYSGMLNDREIDAIIEYIKTLNEQK